MKKSNGNRYIFYAWAGGIYLLIWLLHALESYPSQFGPRAVNEFWRAVYIIPVMFIFFEYTLPYVRRNWKKVLLPLLAIMGQLFLLSSGLYLWRRLGIASGVFTEYITFSSTEKAIAYQASAGMSSLFMFIIMRLINGHLQLRQATQRLQMEKQEAELNYLKSQTNPHFLFNTLNNIYSLARDKSDLAPEAILRLSKILRFMLYETGGAYITIGQELKIITDYIELEKLRYDDSLDVDVEHDIDDMKQPLPPLLLIPLVENAFKHGVSETRGEPFVHVRLSVKEQQLILLVKNSTEPATGEEEVKENIGLANLRRQLELQYKEYDLSVKQNENDFTAILCINLSSHV